MTTRNLAVPAAVSIVLSLFLSAHSLFAAPEQIRYQGRISDGEGLINETQTFVFELFAEEEEGTPLFTETQTVSVVDGLYSVSIGSVNTTPGALASALTNPVVYLGVTVEGFVLLPRERIVSVAYALRAGKADTADTVSDLTSVPFNGLVVGEDQLVTANGNVGIGTSDPQAKLHIGGTPGVDGIMFPDGTVQTTAISADPIPVGTMLPFAAGFAPDGFLLCDGSAVSRTTYSFLFAVIGTSFGAGDGSTTFNVPDMRGRAAIGIDNLGGTPSGRISDGFADTIGGAGGSDTHTLTEAEMPAHNHGVNDPGHEHGYLHQEANTTAASGGGTSVLSPNTTINGTLEGFTGITIGNAGDGEAHNNVQPSLAVGWIIKADASQPLNTPPFVDADALALTALGGSPLEVEGVVNDDGLPNPPGLTTSQWVKVSGPGTVSYDDASALFTTAQFSTNGTYVLGLYAYDGFYVGMDTVTVDVNQAPAIDPGTYPTNLTLVENLDATVTDDGFPSVPGAVTTLWEKVSGPGTVTFGDAAAIDTTASFSTSGVYQLSLSAYDGQLSATETARVSIAFTTPPTVDAGPNQFSSFLSATLGGVITDDGLPDPVTSVWAKVSGPGSVNFADASQLNTTVSFGDAGGYVLSLTGYDGQLSSTDTVSLVIYTGAAPAMVSLDFRFMGSSFTNSGFFTNGVTLIPTDSPGVTGELAVISLQGLAVVGGSANDRIDTSEGVLFDIDGNNNIEIRYTVNIAGNENANGTFGDSIIEAFDSSNVSLGVININDPGTIEVSELYGNVPISKFGVRADGDSLRIREMEYRPGP